MTRLFLADVHANLPAFTAVLDDADPADEVFFLGDIIGCGPHPAACVDLLRDLNAQAIVGNHDLAILARSASTTPLIPPVDWDEWTRRQLSPAQLDYLSSLPLGMSAASCGQNVNMIHRSTADFYLHPAMPDHLLDTYFRDVPGDVVYCAHSHRLINRIVRGRRLVCLPSIGQPRNGDPRAGYAIEKDDRLQFRFVEYDVESTAAALRKIGLPTPFLTRWECFLRTACDPEWSREYLP